MNRRNVIIIYALFFLGIITTASAHSLSDTLKPRIPATGAIKLCNNESHCESIRPNADLEKAIDDGYDNLTIVDLYNDGNQEVAATSPGECTRFFSLDFTTKRFSNVYLEGNGRDVCNYKIDGNRLISSYKFDSKQYEDVYQLKNGAYRLILSDECIGCDQIARSLYTNGRVTEKLLVTNQRDYARRRPLTSSVATKKAWLYAKPSNAARTQSYLSQGDAVQLIEFCDADGLWFLARHLSDKVEVSPKWIRCADLLICK